MSAPSVPNWQKQILQSVGAPVTPQNLTFLNAWTQAEGGSASNNPFNTTQGAPGASSYNSVGVKNYLSPSQGVNATIATLKNGRYENILQALRQGTSSVLDAQALAQSPWGTGNLVLKVLGAPAGPSLGGIGSSAPPSTSSSPSSLLDLLNAGNQIIGLPPLPPGLLEHLASSAPSRQPIPGLPSSPSRGGAPVHPGRPVAGLTSIGGLHDTEGLAGYPAHDYFAKSGSQVVAPISGSVIRLSGHDPRQGPIEGPHGPLGWSVYIQGNDGHIYYLTHMGSRSVRVGEKIHAGQSIGTVADYAKYGTPSHIHMGVH